MLQNIAETASYGTLGAFKELIPIGLCFVQLWSSGLYAQGIIEGLLGMLPLAHLHQLRVEPKLPAGWASARLSEVAVGAHPLPVQVTPHGLDLQHLAGPEPLDLRYRLREAGADLACEGIFGPEPRIIEDTGHRWLQMLLAPGRQARIDVTPERVRVQVPDRREDRAGDGVGRAEETPMAR
jgi:hypothetical protein